MKFLKLIFNYILDLVIPSFGLICLLCAGNWQTRVLGIGITLESFWIYAKNRKEVEE